MSSGHNYEPIVAALQQGAVSLTAFATAVVNSGWNPGNGGVGGQYYNNIVGSSPDPTSAAPVSAGGVVLGTQDYLGTAATGAAASPTSGTTAALLSMQPVTGSGANGAATSAGTGSKTGPPQGGNATAVLAFANAHMDGEDGMDCSAFTQASWAAGGVSIPRTSETQYTSDLIQLVPVDQAVAGDILFAHGVGYPVPGHVALYMGNNQVYQHDPVRTSSLSDWIAGSISEGGFYGVGRVLAQAGNNTNSLANPTALNPSATSIATGAGASGTPSLSGAGLTGAAADGSLTYSTGRWSPSIANADPTALQLTGAKALMLDTPIMPFIDNICQAAMRHYCSAPNGDFIAWFPDYFGQYGYAATWHLSLIELIDFTVDWSDEHLVTHQYVAGAAGLTGGTYNQSLNPLDGGSVSEQDYIYTYGVATIDVPGLVVALTGMNPTDHRCLRQPGSDLSAVRCSTQLHRHAHGVGPIYRRLLVRRLPLPAELGRPVFDQRADYLHARALAGDAPRRRRPRLPVLYLFGHPPVGHAGRWWLPDFGRRHGPFVHGVLPDRGQLCQCHRGPPRLGSIRASGGVMQANVSSGARGFTI